MMLNETVKRVDCCFNYLDNMIIYSKTKEEHLDHVRPILDHLNKANFKLTYIRYINSKGMNFIN